ncbi:MAG: DUF4062 domain-containing protein [Chlorobaculum sp.]|nr:DUF4062 domain-containing protein [Chlorobaculum sp.]
MSKPESASDGTNGKTNHQPQLLHQVMISSTGSDLAAHRNLLSDAINSHGLHPNIMEHDSAKLVDVIESSLEKVRDSTAYILIIGQRYGQTPECPRRNPDKLSITELEFNEAARLGRPTLLFLMGEEHDVKPRDVEKEPEKIIKLNAFRERTKQQSPDSKVHRVYAVFNSLDEFTRQIAAPLTELQKLLEPQHVEPPQPAPAPHQTYRGRVIPAPPAFYAEPDYIGSHKFIGREAQLQELDDWAKAADPTNLLLYEAIGGNGKSMLTWEWATKHATTARADWAGRFWYSFYERGAVMADFCRRALAYMTGRPMEELEKKKTPELAEELIACLHEKPWLLILDGLERVLVAYHRIDAAEVPDEEANAPTDKILNRNPCDAIREEESDLLRRLAAAAPSKILVSSRLTPRALLNPAGQPIPGAKRITLPGLRPADAEALFRACEIRGSSEKIQEYLSQNCDNHPLVIGVLAGLVANYLPDRGNFDAWVADASSQGGAYLNLAKLDLTQRRNHILTTAFEALPKKSRQLLSTLALISASVDYETLSAFNPHIPCEPDEEKLREAPGKLPETVKDLEQRGLLQFDRHSRRYDLHPVVRGVAAGAMKTEETTRYGQHVIDHFSSLPHQPYEQAKTIEDVATGIQVVRTLLKLERFENAVINYLYNLADTLTFNLEAHTETLSLLQPLFPFGWDQMPKNIDIEIASEIVNYTAIALSVNYDHEITIAAYCTSLLSELERKNWEAVSVRLCNISNCFENHILLTKSLRVSILDHDLNVTLDNRTRLYMSLLSIFSFQSITGQWYEATTTWQKLDPLGRAWPRSYYRQGETECVFAWNQFFQGLLEEKHLETAERLARKDNNRSTLRSIIALRGEWRLEQQEWRLAAESFHEALSMARERGLTDAGSETGLALAKFNLGQFHSPDEARHEAERLSTLREPAHRFLAMLWRELGDLEQAKKHALAAYKRAWADGEPFVWRYELEKATELLREMNIPIPDLPPYDPAKNEPFPWEADVRKAIEKLRAEKEAERKK